MDTDRKLAITVAAVVGVGLASIVGLSLMRTEETDRSSVEAAAAARPARMTDAVTPVVAPASVSLASAVSTTNPVSAGTPAEAEIYAVEPGVNYLSRGIEKYQAREFDHAATYFFAEVEARPGRPYSHYLLGLSLWKAGRLEESVDAMSRSAELDPTAIRTFVNLSRIQNDRREFEAALEAAWNALDLDAGDPAALFLAGRSLHNLGDHAQAADLLARSLEADADNGFVWNLLGLTLLAQERDQDALDAFRTAASFETEVAYIQNNLGMALELNGDTREAVAAYQRALDADPDHFRAAGNLARLEPVLTQPSEPEGVGVAAAAVPAGDED